MKFMNYMCSYMAFLVFLLIATTSKNTTSNSEPWVVRGFIIFYVFGEHKIIIFSPYRIFLKQTKLDNSKYY